MKNDDLSWLAGELGLPVLEETAAGLLASAAARAALLPGQLALPTAMNEAAAQLMSIPVDDSRLLLAIAAARGGERLSALLGPNAAGQSFRLLASPAGSEEAGMAHRIRLTISPSRDASTHERGWIDVAAAVSHEVANAVGTIRGWADLALHADSGTIDVRDALGLIRSAARSAEQAARSMLSLARGQASDTAEQPLDLSQFADELLQLLTLGAREARVSLEASIEPGLHVRASRAQLFTILFNLLKNAVEACKPGGLVRVRAHAERDRVHVSVTDTGPGLDPAFKQRIFERYYTTKATGTGLGLALVKSATDASRATLELESELGRGTVFRVGFERVSGSDQGSVSPLPLAEVEWSTVQSGGETSGRPLAIRVLVVDDDHALREMLATALSLRGAEVTSVRSSEEALELAGPFDVALIDMMLDDCRGDELLALLRQQGVINAAMLVTGTVQKPRLVPGGEPDDWVRKPFEISHLVDRIRRTLERHRLLDAASQSARA